MSNDPQPSRASIAPIRLSSDSPRSGATAAPVNTAVSSPSSARRQTSCRSASGQLSNAAAHNNEAEQSHSASGHNSYSLTRPRSHSHNETAIAMAQSNQSPGSRSLYDSPGTPRSRASSRKSLTDASLALAKAKSRNAQKLNDSMVYLDGPQVYTCAQCRTHLTSHDDIISKSFHGRHGRAYLFDQCVNVSLDPCENRRLITGLHSVSDIRCKRCEIVVGWTYLKAYDASQKYKEGKFIIEKINLHLEESDYYNVSHPAGERSDRFRLRSMSWGSDAGGDMPPTSPRSDLIYEYRPRSTSTSSVPSSPGRWGAATSPRIHPRRSGSGSPNHSAGPPLPPF